MKPAKGVVAIEFLMLFPFVMAMLYASASYGITFFAKYRMQDAVDRAVAAALYVDRSNPTIEIDGDPISVEEAAVGRARLVLNTLTGAFSWPGEREGNCEWDDDSGIKLVHCTLTYKEYSQAGNAIVPALNFGMLGSFPPLPDNLTAEARAAF
ncbi:hypothetical protein CEK62_17050 [Alcanivorax sp. N3-2A]|nr:hypothetical protein CEK62_17050 [Alcanivorax sp. N3-2A]|tara:strand:+ start:19452 stop:19910 length:459 start_codon:yes stop_codon:yes gene_type:complete